MGLGIMFLPRLSPIQTWGGGFVLYATASLLWSPDWTAGVELASLVLAFWLGTRFREIAGVLLFLISWLAASLLLIPWMPWALYGNPNYLGTALAFSIAICLAYGFWPVALLLAPPLLYTGSRGAILAACVALVLYLVPRHRWVIALAVAGVLALIPALGSHDAGLSLLARFGIWQDTIMNSTLWGSGWGSFYEAYWHFPRHVSPTPLMTGVRAAHVYNDFLELVFMLGIGSIPLWLLIAHCLEGTDERAKLVCWTFFILALTFFPLWVPGVGQAFALTLGHLSRSRPNGSRTERSIVPASAIRPSGVGA